MRYIEHKISSGGKGHAVNIIYERALKELPGRYLFWKNSIIFDYESEAGFEITTLYFCKQKYVFKCMPGLPFHFSLSFSVAVWKR